MIRVYPFRALLPVADKAAEIASEPYDVISADEARQRAVGREHSFLHVVRPEIDFDASQDPYGSEVYQQAANNLQQLIESEILVEQPKPALFVYQQTFRDHRQAGVVCCYDVQQYRDETIKKHEKTRPEKEDDRTRHLTMCSAHAEPVFLSFKSTTRLTKLISDQIVRTPLIDFQADDEVRHTIWKVENPDDFISGFEDLDCVYIADGHHRTAAAERAATQRQGENPDHTGQEEYNRVLSVMFPHDQLRILPYNRVVKDLNGLAIDEILAKLKEIGQLVPTEDPNPDTAGEICLYFPGQWYRFRFFDDVIDHSDPVNSLDVALLQSKILEPILGVGDPRTDPRIAFVGGIRGTAELEKLVDSGKQAVAFSMYPTSMDQLIDVSDAGEIMPPKSTWFEPKLRSGLFVHCFESYQKQEC